MDLYFHSKEELFRRVRPALKAKVNELERLGFKDISSIDVWNYLILKKWKDGVGLMLSDIVDDILNTDSGEINSYVMEIRKNIGTQTFDDNVDLI